MAGELLFKRGGTRGGESTLGPLKSLPPKRGLRRKAPAKNAPQEMSDKLTGKVPCRAREGKTKTGAWAGGKTSSGEMAGEPS